MEFEKLKHFMDRLTAWTIPGNSVRVYKDGKEVFTYSSGYSDLENKIKMNGAELLNIYSCSKPITITAAMQLYEKGYFLLSDPLYEYLPAYKEMMVLNENGEIEKAKKPITLKNLFTMTAGFSYDLNQPAIKKAYELTSGKMDTKTVINTLAEAPLLFEPGDRWQYSLCHDVLAGVVEAISGMKFRDYVKKNIFEPLEMNDSSYHNDDVLEKMAQQYLLDVSSESDFVKLQSANDERSNGNIKNVGKQNEFVFGPEYDSGGAGITTSLSDYGKFAAAMAAGGVGMSGERILSGTTIDLIRTNQLDENHLKFYNWEQLLGYGYGLGVRTMIDRSISGSNGSIGEFGWGGAAGASLLVDKDINLAVVYAHHMLNPQEGYYQPRLRNVIYSCI